MPNVKIASIVPRGTPVADSGWRLAHDLAVEFESDEKYVIATNTCVDEYGHGSNRAEALGDLLTSLLGLFESLREQQQEAELADELVQTLEKLDALLVEGE